MRIEGEAAAGKSFALRATVAYKGVWVRLVRAFCEPEIAGKAAVRFAQAVTQLPSGRGFDGFDSFVVEGCRVAQPLEPLLGSRLDAANPPSPGAIVSVQATLAVDSQAVPVGAPVLIGAPGEAASLLIDPLFG